MITFQDLDFNDCTVTQFVRKGSVLELEVEDAVKDRPDTRVTVRLSPVTSVEIEDVPSQSESNLMEGENGEILELRPSEEGYFLLMTWNKYLPSWTKTLAYELKGDQVTASVVGVSDPPHDETNKSNPS